MQDLNTINSKRKLINFKLTEIWQFRDLLILFARREIVVLYKQTILGPLWFFIQPILTTLMFTVVFGNIAGIPTDGLPQMLFYLSGITAWNYFADILKLTSETFRKNSVIFGKVYFPRVILPMAIVISNFFKFLIQLFLFIGFIVYYLIQGTDIVPNYTLFLLPIYIFVIAGLGLGFGLIISALTTKYRDLTFLIQFGIQLWMYATPIIYPLSEITGKLRIFILANPMTPIIEGFKYAFLGEGSFNIIFIGYSVVFTIIILILGLIVFNRTENNFIDTV